MIHDFRSKPEFAARGVDPNDYAVEVPYLYDRPKGLGLSGEQYQDTTGSQSVNPLGMNGEWLDGATRYDIPELVHGTRPSTDYMVVHRTEGYGYHPNDPRIRQQGIGAQITIDRKGNIYQSAPLDAKTWHAGKYNNNSIGVELTGRYKGNGQWDPLTPAQQQALLRVGAALK